MKADNSRIYAVLPAFNETGKVGRVVEKIIKTGRIETIVVVDDCSTDDTGAEAERNGAIVFKHKINRGVGAAIRTGIKYGIDNNFDTFFYAKLVNEVTYATYASSQVYVNDEEKEYVITFVMNDVLPAGETVRIEFDFGLTGQAQITLDDIKLIEGN